MYDLEAVAVSHFDDDEVVVVVLGLLARGVLGEQRFD